MRRVLYLLLGILLFPLEPSLLSCWAGGFAEEPVTVVDHNIPLAPPVFVPENGRLRIATAFGLGAGVVTEHDVRTGQQISRTLVDDVYGRVHLPARSLQVVVPGNDHIRILDLLPHSSAAEAPLPLPFQKGLYTSVVSSEGTCLAISDAFGEKVYMHQRGNDTAWISLPESIFVKPNIGFMGPTPVAVSNQGIVFLDDENEFVAYDVSKKQARWTLSIDRPGTVFARLAADEMYLLLAITDVETKKTGIRLIETASGRIVWEEESGELVGGDVGSAGQLVMLLTKDGQVELCSPQKGGEKQLLTVSGTIHSGSLAPDLSSLAVVRENNGRYQTLIFASGNGSVAAEGSPPLVAPRKLIVQTGHTQALSAMALSADGLMMATADCQGDVWLWETKSGRAIRKLDLSGQQLEHVNIKEILFNPAKSELLILSQSGTFVWDLNDTPARQIQGRGWASWGETACFFPGGATFATLSQDSGSGMLLVVNDTSGSVEPRMVKVRDGQDLIAPMTFAPTADLAACSTKAGGVALVKVASGEIQTPLVGVSGKIQAVTFGHDGALLASATAGEIMISDVRTGALVAHVATTLNDIQTLAIHPRQKVLVAAGGGQLAFIDFSGAETHVSYARWKPDQSIAQTTRLFFSPDGRVLYQACTLDPTFVRAFSLEPAGKFTAFVAHAMYGAEVCFAPDDTSLIVGRPGSFTFWDLEVGKMKRKISSDVARVAQIHPRGLRALVATRNETGQQFKLWSPERGGTDLMETNNLETDPQTGEVRFNTFDRIGFSPDGRMLHMLSTYHQNIYDLKKKKNVVQAQLHTQLNGAYAYSADMSQIAVMTEENKLVVLSLETGNELWRTQLDFSPESLFFTEDGAYISAYWSLGFCLIDGETGRLIQNEELHGIASKAKNLIPVRHGTFANFLIATRDDGLLHVFNIQQQRSVRQTKVGNAQAVDAIEGHNGEIYIANSSGLLSEIHSAGSTDRELVAVDQRPTRLVLSHNEKYMAILLEDGSIMLFDLAAGQVLARLVEFLDGSWAVVAPDGRYDAANPGDIPGLSWVLGDDPYTPRPVEIFMQEYYEPRLLSRLMAGDKLPAIKTLESLNRMQPGVEIVSVRPDAEKENAVTVTVQVQSPEGKQPPDGSDVEASRDVFDLRLFRDGQLVGVFPDSPGRIKIDQESGKRVVVFDGIQLPTRKKEKKVTFTAYAFNEDRVKSPTAKADYTLSDETAPRKPTAYIVAIGVNAYENPSWNLRYAANDAVALNEVLAQRLRDSGAFGEVVSIPLVSDQGAAQKATRNPASAGVVKAVLARLAGRDVSDKDLPALIPEFTKLQRATPDDLLIISYSGHGLTDARHQFHLFPYDVGAGTERVVDDALLRHTISSDDLALWLRDVDAGRIIMIIDACNSASSVEGEGFRPGPMGSRGLGQLAYNKGMRVLTASQAEAVALENDQIRHGLLTYALIQEGLKAKQADCAPRDQRIFAGEWLAYGETRVPELYKLIESGKTDQLVSDDGARGTVVYLGAKQRSGKERFNVQQPSLFDFAADKSDFLLIRSK